MFAWTWKRYEDGRWESERMIERSKREWKARKKENRAISIPVQYQMWHQPDAIWTYRGESGKERFKFIEIEVSSKGIKKTADIMQDLRRHGITWYFVEMDPHKGAFPTLIEALNTLDEPFKEQFYMYDLAILSKQVYPAPE